MAPVRLHTRVIEQVLAPIADHVSQLIVVEEQARRTGTPMPDLTLAAEAVGIAIERLVQAGRASIDKGDGQLKSRMPTACEQIEAAGKLFMDATLMFKNDPHSEDARNLLVQAARGLLAGTTNVFITFDAYEVRKIVTTGETLIERLALAKQDVSNMEQLLVVMRPVSEEVVRLAQLAAARHEQLLNPALQQRLKLAGDTLRKSSPLLVTALRTFIQNRDNAQACAGRDYAVDQVVSATHEIILVVSTSEQDDDASAEAPGAYVKAVGDVQTLLLATDVGVDSEALVKDIMEAARVSEEVALNCGSEARAQTIRDLARRVQETAEVFEATRAGAAQERLADALRRDLAALEQHLKSAVASAMAQVAMEEDVVPQLVSRVAEASLAGRDLSNEKQAVRRHTMALTKAALNASALSDDPRRVQRVKITSHQLERCSEQLLAAAEVVHCKPADEAAQAHMALLRDAYLYRTDALKEAVGGMLEAERVIIVTGETLQDSMDLALALAKNGNADGLQPLMQHIAAAVEHIQHVSHAEEENSTHKPFRDRIIEASGKLGVASEQYKQRVAALAQAPTDGNREREVLQSAAQVRRAVHDVTYAVRGQPMAAAAAATAAGASVPDMHQALEQLQITHAAQATGDADADDQEEQEDPDSLFADKANPPTGPIAAAARSLKKEADRWSAKENPIVQTASLMAEKMARMAGLASQTAEALQTDEQGHKGDMIATAKEIAAASKGIQEQALKLAHDCPDKRLKQELMFLCNRLPTISTQLKIIASVKAAATNTDTTEADAMLVKNAYNLMETVQRIVRASEAASVKRFAYAASTTSTLIRWKRKSRKHHA